MHSYDYEPTIRQRIVFACHRLAEFQLLMMIVAAGFCSVMFVAYLFGIVPAPIGVDLGLPLKGRIAVAAAFSAPFWTLWANESDSLWWLPLGIAGALTLFAVL